jgi:transcription elongation GreA/GreB family factor
MRPPNTHYIREFNNRATIVAGKQIIDNDEIRKVQSELVDLLGYVLQLENKIGELEEKLENADVINVEMIGKDF